MATAPKPKTEPKIKTTVTATGTIDIPTKKTNRGGASIYPFDSLTTIGMSFGVTGRDIRSVRSAVSAQNRKFKTPMKSADGNLVMKPDGSGPKTTYTTHFETIEVDADIAAAVKGSHLEGASVIVRRDI